MPSNQEILLVTPMDLTLREKFSIFAFGLYYLNLYAIKEKIMLAI